jgi:hypothetical protein
MKELWTLLRLVAVYAEQDSIQLSYGRASNASADILGRDLGSARNTAERNLNGFGWCRSDFKP